MESIETPFQFYIQTIGRGQKRRRSLTKEEAKDAMRQILNGSVTPMQIGAFLMLIRVREETPEEAAGFVEAIREKMAAPQCEVDVDWGSYAGKRRQLPWFLLALTLLTKNGYRVLLHGVVGNDSNRLYSQAIAEQLGWPVADNLDEAKRLIEKVGYCYLPLENFSPEVKILMGYRDELGLRSPIHSLARMLNPFQARLSVHGVFHKGYDDIHQQAASYLTDPLTAAFCGDGGEADVRPDRKTEIKLTENVLEKVNDVAHNQSDSWSTFLPKIVTETDPTKKCLDSEWLMKVWRGKAQDQYGEASLLHAMTVVLTSLENMTFEEAHEKALQFWTERQS